MGIETFNFPIQANVIKCPKCQMEFVLYAVIRGEGDNDDTVIWRQEKTYFCPYCGTKLV